MTRWLLLGVIVPMLGSAFITTEQGTKLNTPAPILIRESRTADRLICAEYTSTAAPRQPNRSCVSAAQVRSWILQNGREDCP